MQPQAKAILIADLVFNYPRVTIPKGTVILVSPCLVAPQYFTAEAIEGSDLGKFDLSREEFEFIMPFEGAV